MKRPILAAALLLPSAALALPAGAQDSGFAGVGVKAGYSSSTLAGDDLDEPGVDVKRRGRFTGGVFATFALGPRFALQPEVLLLSQGAKVGQGGNRAEIKLDYVDVPLLLKGYLTSEGVRPHVFAGPDLAFKRSAKSRAESGGTTGEIDLDDDPDTAVKGTDFGLTFGAGVDVPLGARSAFTLEGRYRLGLSGIEKNNSGGGDTKNRSFMVMAGMRF